MAITDKKTGVWGLDQTYNKINQGSIWDYSGITRFFTWGGNNYGASGLSAAPTGRYSSPVQLPGDNQWSKIGSSGYGRGFLGLKTDGTLWAWGRNHKGQIGSNTVTTPGVSSPIQIGTDTTWGSEFSLVSHALAIKTDGTLWAWGENAYGGLAQNNTTLRSSPVQIPGTTWSKVTTTNQANIATKTDGTLWAWGYNHRGQLGQNNTTPYSSPVQIPGDWSGGNIGSCASENDFFAIKTDGTLWAWGFNVNNGTLAQNDRTDRSSPVQIPGTTWSGVFGGANHVIATKTDGTLWSWGGNGDGSLGINQGHAPGNVGRSSPTQIPGTTWNTGAGGQNFSVITKTDGTIWAWGNNTYGQIGQNTGFNDGADDYSSPVQVGSDAGWSEPAAAAYDVFAKKTL